MCNAGCAHDVQPDVLPVPRVRRDARTDGSWQPRSRRATAARHRTGLRPPDLGCRRLPVRARRDHPAPSNTTYGCAMSCCTAASISCTTTSSTSEPLPITSRIRTLIDLGAVARPWRSSLGRSSSGFARDTSPFVRFATRSRSSHVGAGPESGVLRKVLDDRVLRFEASDSHAEVVLAHGAPGARRAPAAVSRVDHHRPRHLRGRFPLPRRDARRREWTDTDHTPSPKSSRRIAAGRTCSSTPATWSVATAQPESCAARTSSRPRSRRSAESEPTPPRLMSRRPSDLSADRD